MKTFWSLLVGIFLVVAGAAQARDVWVNGYTKKNGTVVHGHYRTVPDGDTTNNYSAPGNVNPYNVGEEPEKRPPREDMERERKPGGRHESTSPPPAGTYRCANADGTILESSIPCQDLGLSAAQERPRGVRHQSKRKAGASYKNDKPSRHEGGYIDERGILRDEHGKIERSESAKREFLRANGFPGGRPGYEVHHFIPLHCGGSDTPENMVFLTVEEHRAVTAKDRREGCP